MRGRSFTPSPPRGGYGRRRRSPSPRGRYGSRSRDAPTSLLVRNLRHDCRPEDLRRPFGQFGPVKDIYLPRDYYTGNPRGFGFIQYLDPQDAADAKYQMDGQIFHGRELTVVFAEENRKKPTEMRQRESRGGTGRHYDRRRSPPPRYSRSRSPRYSKSPLPRSRSGARDYGSPSPKRAPYSRSISPPEKKRSKERPYSPQGRGRSPHSRSPPLVNRSRSPSRSLSPRETRAPSRSRSPMPESYRRESDGERSPSP